MRKLLSIGFLVFTITLAGCGNDETTNSIDSDQEITQDNAEIIEKDNEETEVEEANEEEVVEALYQLNEGTWAIEPIDPETNEKVVLLTIDDAPDKHGLDMAKTLVELDAKAIFFVNGHFLETEESKKNLKDIYDMGFLIGNHTYSHKSLPDLPEDEQKEEIIRVNEMVEEITGEKPLFFRAPFGANTDYTRSIVSGEGMLLMNWSYGYDWDKEYTSKEAITDIMINAPELRDGANLLMHDREWTSEALEDIVIGLREKGYEFVDPLAIQTN